MPTYSAIVAYSQNRAIGKNNQLLWRLPNDLKHFKALTLNKPLVLGRKTYESIGRPLPHRRNIILTRDQHFHPAGCEVVHSVDALEKLVADEPEVMIGGGAEIYRLLMPFTTRLYITEVQAVLEGDVYFPEIDMNVWREVSRESHAMDDTHAYPYDFVLLARAI